MQEEPVERIALGLEWLTAAIHQLAQLALIPPPRGSKPGRHWDDEMPGSHGAQLMQLDGDGTLLREALDAATGQSRNCSRH